jgi:hypothetical protein
MSRFSWNVRLKQTIVATFWLIASGVALISYYLRTTRLILVNNGLVLSVPYAYTLVCIASVIYLLTLALLSKARFKWIYGGISTLVIVVLIALMLIERVEIDGRGVAKRRLTGYALIAWNEVEHVTVDPRSITVHGKSSRFLKIDLLRLPAVQRAAIQRSIARRVNQERAFHQPDS